MKTFITITLGCKVNQYESQQVQELLRELGLHGVNLYQKPDLVVVNTCCVTQIASAKSKKYIRKAQKLCPNSVIVVIGCFSAPQISKSLHPGKNVHFVEDRNYVATFLQDIVSNNTYNTGATKCPDTIIKPENGRKIKYKKKLPLLTSFSGQTRAFLKIQDGCDAWCSYCIIPRTRPLVSSKPVEEVLQEIRALVANGHKEIVITGIFLGAYGQSSTKRNNWPNQQNDKLANLLDLVTNIPKLTRVRLSSLEPADLTPRLIDTITKHHNIMPHIHLSLQSGSDAILYKMRRQYNAEQVIEKIELLKTKLDNPAITTDIIVGFPGETEEDFQKTVDLARLAGFSKMHVFRFSPRLGTAAAKMKNCVHNSVIKRRAEILHNLDIKMGYKFREKFIGSQAEVLLETTNDRASGRSERYFMVHIDNSDGKLKKNDLVRIKIISNSPSGAIGAIQHKQQLP